MPDAPTFHHIDFRKFIHRTYPKKGQRARSVYPRQPGTPVVCTDDWTSFALLAHAAMSSDAVLHMAIGSGREGLQARQMTSGKCWFARLL